VIICQGHIVSQSDVGGGCRSDALPILAHPLRPLPVIVQAATKAKQIRPLRIRELDAQRVI